MYKYVHNNKYQIKYMSIIINTKLNIGKLPSIVSEARKELKDNIYAEWSMAGIFFEK